MNTTLRTACAVATLGLAATPAAAQELDPVHTHIGHVAETFRGTPENMGLLPAALAEAEIARRHAALAMDDPEDLEAVQRHVGHVVNALDPSREASGPGLGYGLIPAAAGAAHHIELASASEGASDNVRTHATHVATAARNAVATAEQVLELAEQIEDAEEAAEAAELLQELARLTDVIADGIDADDDGRVGWQEGEGGLAQADTHLGLLMDGEGMGR